MSELPSAAYLSDRHDLALEALTVVRKSDLAGQASLAMVMIGALLGELDRSEEAIAVYDDVVERFAADATPAVREQVARALFNKGATLGQLDRSEEEIAVYDDVVERFADDATPRSAK